MKHDDDSRNAALHIERAQVLEAHRPRRIDILLRLLDDHAAHARHVEDQRWKIIQLALILAGAAGVFLTKTSTFDRFSLWSVGFGFSFVGIWAWMAARKQYERNRMHVKILDRFSAEVDCELRGCGSDLTLAELRAEAVIHHHRPKHNLGDFLLQALHNGISADELRVALDGSRQKETFMEKCLFFREHAKLSHKLKDFPKVDCRLLEDAARAFAKDWSCRIRLNFLWNTVPAVVLILGFGVLVYCVWTRAS